MQQGLGRPTHQGQGLLPWQLGDVAEPDQRLDAGGAADEIVDFNRVAQSGATNGGIEILGPPPFAELPT